MWLSWFSGNRNLPTDELIERAIAFFKNQVNKLDSQIATVIRQCEQLTAKSDILLPCPGVGVATEAMLLSELPGLGRLSRGQVA